MSHSTYQQDPYRESAATTIVEVLPANGGSASDLDVVLEDTVIYPEGGGQPGDTGFLIVGGRSLPVLETVRVESGIRHRMGAEGPNASPGKLHPGEPLFEELSVGLACEVVVDWRRRYDHMQQHTAQHLLSAIAEDRHGWRTTAFHLGAQVSDVELSASSLSSSEMAQLEEEINLQVRQPLQVECRWVASEDLASLKVRSRGLPDGHEGDVRLVEIEGLDLSTCGGTHLASTSEIESVKLLGSESMRGGTRLTWVAGARTRKRLGEQDDRLSELRSVLEGSDDELVGLARLKKDQVLDLRKRLRVAGEQPVEVWLQAALDSEDSVAFIVVDPLPAVVVASLARQFAKAAIGPRVLLVASAEGPFAVAVGADADAQALGRRVAELWGARGGGKGPVFQGKAEFGSVAKATEMLGQARELLST